MHGVFVGLLFVLGNCFCAQRNVDGPRTDRRRGEKGCLCCSERQISAGKIRLRGDSCAQTLFLSMVIRSALPSFFGNGFFDEVRISLACEPQVGLRTRMRSSPRGISTAFQVEAAVWSNHSLLA
jgi:hypothetical protein